MKLDFLNETENEYISVNQKGFTFMGKKYKHIQCFIQKIIPVRKLFNDRKLICYSNDGKYGKNDQLCSLCPKRIKCRKRIRLMLIVSNNDKKQTPALLEINSNSFGNLKKALEPITPEELPELLFSLNVIVEGKYLKIDFKPIF